MVSPGRLSLPSNNTLIVSLGIATSGAGGGTGVLLITKPGVITTETPNSFLPCGGATVTAKVGVGGTAVGAGVRVSAGVGVSAGVEVGALVGISSGVTVGRTGVTVTMGWLEEAARFAQPDRLLNNTLATRTTMNGRMSAIKEWRDKIDLSG